MIIYYGMTVSEGDNDDTPDKPCVVNNLWNCMYWYDLKENTNSILDIE